MVKFPVTDHTYPVLGLFSSNAKLPEFPDYWYPKERSPTVHYTSVHSGRIFQKWHTMARHSRNITQWQCRSTHLENNLEHTLNEGSSMNNLMLYLSSISVRLAICLKYCDLYLSCYFVPRTRTSLVNIQASQCAHSALPLLPAYYIYFLYLLSCNHSGLGIQPDNILVRVHFSLPF